MSSGIDNSNPPPSSLALSRGEIVTFYSYKGGVGRSMALANVATLLAQAQKRVLAVDFDFEAPGLHRYFSRPGSSLADDRPGMIEILIELRTRLDREAAKPSVRPPIPRRRGPDRSNSARSSARGLDERAETTERVVQQLVSESFGARSVRVRDPNQNRDASLDLVPAGRFDDGYASRIRDFDWQGLYESHPDALRLLADALSARYDYVLVDSRTGLSDVGSICTVILPEKLVLVFTPNEQSLNGAVQVGREAVEARKRSVDLRPLPIFPLVSRVENAEEALQRAWIADARQRFEAVFRSVYGLESCDLTAYFDAVRIPHKSAFSYGEQVSAEQQRVIERGSLAAAFHDFASALQANNVVDAQPQILSRLVDPNEAQARAAEAEQRARNAEARAAKLSQQVSTWRILRRVASIAVIPMVVLLAIAAWRLWPNQEEALRSCVERELLPAPISPTVRSSIMGGISLTDGFVAITAGQPLYRAILDPATRGAFAKCNTSELGMGYPIKKAYLNVRVVEGDAPLAHVNITEKSGDSCETDPKGACRLQAKDVTAESKLALDLSLDGYLPKQVEVLAGDVTDPIKIDMTKRLPKAPVENEPQLEVLPGHGNSPLIGSDTPGTISNAAKVVASLRAAFRNCYMRGLVNNPELFGSVHLTIRVGATGAVQTVDANTTGLNAAVTECVKKAALTAKFDPPEGGSAVISVPVSFVKQ